LPLTAVCKAIFGQNQCWNRNIRCWSRLFDVSKNEKGKTKILEKNLIFQNLFKDSNKNTVKTKLK